MTVFEVRTYNPRTKKTGRRVLRECVFQQTAEEICRALAERKDRACAVTQEKKILFVWDPGPTALRDLLKL